MESSLREKAIALWQQSLTSYQIAERLGVSRNAVLGVIKRHRDKGNQLRGKVVKIQKPKPVEVLFDYLEPKTGVSLFGLRHSSCRYIIGEDESAIYCGRTKERGSYCAEHYRLCYVPVKKDSKNKVDGLWKSY